MDRIRQTLADLGEAALVAQILEILGDAAGERVLSGGGGPPPDGPRVRVGPGDDAAVVRVQGGRVVVSTDSQHEGVHFHGDWIHPTTLGRRAIAVNASDLGAMGAEPLCFVVALALPAGTEVGWVERLVSGMREAAESFGADIVGGDVAQVARGTAINVTALGRLDAGVRPVRRSGARPGDRCWITGRPGRAAAGRALLAAGMRLEEGGELDRTAFDRAAIDLDRDSRAAAVRCLRCFLSPQPAVSFGVRLGRRGLAAAMIDVSDGLARDLQRLCGAGGVGAELDGDILLADPDLQRLERAGVGRVEQWVLGGGDDYQLLFAAAAASDDDVRSAAAGVEARAVGIFREAGGAVRLRRGNTLETLPAAGWDHFA